MKQAKFKIKGLGIVLLILCIFVTVDALPQQSAEELFEAAVYKKDADGDLEGAIKIFSNILSQFPENKQIAAKAQLNIGLCYEKLGRQNATEALQAFQKVIDNYPEQSEAVKTAREKLALISQARAAMSKGNKEMSIRKIWEGFRYGSGFYGMVSPDGKYLSLPDGDLAIKDLITGKTRRLTNHNKTKEEKGFASFAIWSPDGTKIAYAWEYNADESEVLEVVGLDGSNPRILFQEKGKYIMPYTWSPDGKSILVSIEQTLYLISDEDGSLQELKTFEKGSSPLFMSGYRFSPDGQYIAYESLIKGEKVKHEDIVLFSIEKKSEIPLVKHPAHDFVIGWSPGGEHFLFGSDRDGSVGVYALPFINGESQGEPELIKSGLGSLTALGIANDGSFYYGIWNDFMDIYTTTLDFKSDEAAIVPHKVPLPYEGYNRFPHYSPDGKRLAYVSMRGAEPEHVLCIYSFETGKTEEFRSNYYFLLAPKWSPDGNRVLYTGFTRGTMVSAIHQISPNTGEIAPLIPGEKGKFRAAQWSPDGKSIFYLDLKPPNKGSKYVDFEIVQHDLENGETRPIWRYNSANSVFLLLAVSPDGDRLACVQRDLDAKQDILWVVPTSGGTPEQVYVLDRKKNAFGYLEWTADSRHIIFSAEDKMRNSAYDLMRISADGEGEPEILKVGMQELWCFDIHPDGKSVVFASSGKTKKNVEIWVMENFLKK